MSQPTVNLLSGNVARARFARRDLIRLGALGALGAGGLASPAAFAATRPDVPKGTAKARSCIFIFLCGGPSQLDMWDPKPEAPIEIRGPFKPIQTTVPGTQFGELLPQVAKQADKFAIIRSMSHESTVHDIGILKTLLASKSENKKAFPAQATDHPALGSLLANKLGVSGALPPWVVLPRFFTTGNRFYKGQTSGFLGAMYEPFEIGAPKTDSLARTEFDLQKLEFDITDFDPERFERRRKLLGELDRNGGTLASLAPIQRTQEVYERAFGMFSNTGVKDVFDVTREPLKLRERYGMNEYGQSFLLARRLSEAGVKMVNVFWTYYGPDGCQFNLWDNHGSDKDTVCGGPSKGVDMIKHDYCCPSFDRAFSALLEDLDQRGKLQETLVVVVGEFGRTPKINKNAGRDHWGACYSAVLAGAGVQGGAIYGESDKYTSSVKDSPVSPYDLHATILHAFGVAQSTTVVDKSGRPIPITDGTPVKALFS